MHPIERLRWVARAPAGDLSLMAAEAADALASFADDPAGLVIASRRLIERRPAAGPLWWLASRVLCALDPAFEAMDAAADLERDRTPVTLAGDLPGGTIAIVGWPDHASSALRIRGRMSGDESASDRVLVVPSAPDSWGCVDWLQGHALDARLLHDGEVAAAGKRCVLALLEASAVGPDSFVAATGSAALAASARDARRPVWLVAGVGRALPAPLYDALLRRIDGDEAVEVVPLDTADEIVGPNGPVLRAQLARVSCPVAAELLRFSG
ncbi:MAG TPA: hypothetical protein VEG38_04975 [Acidimicrobiia bacterium]|nr:hypothetical protein [Acidimicrobiia bacterium]